MKENTAVNKRLYKVFISLIKVLPNVIALLQILSLLLNYFDVNSFMITCLGGTSIIFIIVLYLLLYVFKFCGLYRISLNYITTVTSITIYDFYLKIPLTLLDLYYLYAAITGVFLISWIVYWYTHRNNPKINHLKQLCDNVCC